MSNSLFQQDPPDNTPVVPVYFVSDSTGITAEAMGNAILVQFPHLTFERISVPFLTDTAAADRVVEDLNRKVDAGEQPLVFSTTVSDEIRERILQSKANVIDLFGTHLGYVEETLGTQGVRQTAQLHSLRDRVKALEKKNA